MSYFQIAILAIIQGLAELLPVSSSSHVIIAQKLMGVDPAAPEMTFLLVMLHTGTMFAAIFYFWKRWWELLRGPRAKAFITHVVIATGVTGVLGLTLKHLIEKQMGIGEVENLFRVLPLMAFSLTMAGTLILIAGYSKKKMTRELREMTAKDSLWIGAIQGLALPLRGFSRSGVTISTAMLRGMSREFAEEFSFALAVVLTPPVVILQFRRLMKSLAAQGVSIDESLHQVAGYMMPGLVGMVFAFATGMFALRWLSSWLEGGRWKYFGYYCYFAACVILFVHFRG